MEIHHHPHVEKKRFKEYLLEFIMIFLAVTMGFFAENIRENISDKRQIHGYMQSMVSDLENDLALYNQSMEFNYGHRSMIDSIITSITQHKNNTTEIYYAARKLTMGSTVVTPDSKTFEQMKSGNGFRLIKNRALADSIADYYQWIKQFEYWSDLQRQRIGDVIAVNDKLFDATAFFSIIKQLQQGIESENNLKTKPTLITTDPAVINTVLMQYQYYYGMLHLMDIRLVSASATATRLINLLKKEYSINNE